MEDDWEMPSQIYKPPAVQKPREAIEIDMEVSKNTNEENPMEENPAEQEPKGVKDIDKDMGVPDTMDE